MRFLFRVGRRIPSLSRFLLRCYNGIVGNGFRPVFVDTTLVECMAHSLPGRSAINDHICTLFSDLLVHEPSLIVELGTRGGESTGALIAAARHVGARVLSIDVAPRPEMQLPACSQEIWDFVQANNVEFGKTGFTHWCESHGLEPVVDVLFIDTSHQYEQTRQEIDVWFRFVRDNGMAIFHDTNMRNVYRRMDNTIGIGWDNSRGVIRAIEEFLGREYDETRFFVDVTDEWLIRHHPHSSGLTYMKRRRSADRGQTSGRD